jgi:hypothetical protein
MGKKLIHLYDPLYLANVDLRIGKGSNLFGCYVERIVKNNTVRYVVSMENRDDFYSLLHECVHLVKHIFADRQIPFDARNDEAIAYYQTWWFKKLWRASHKCS